MARKILKPLNPPRISQPSDNPDGEGTFELDASELFLFDLYAQEHIAIAGTEIGLFQRGGKGTRVDPYYGETVESGFDGPFKLKANVDWPEETPEVSEEGLRFLWPGAMWVPRKSLEDVGAAPVKEGDIVHFWSIPYFDEVRGTQGTKTKRGGFFFDIIKVNEDGHLHDTAAFVGFRCSLKRRSDTPAELSLDVLKKLDDPC